MREKTFDDYLNEMLKMYENKKTIPAVSENIVENTGKGSIIVVVNGGNNAIPLKNAKVKIMNKNGIVLYEILTDESGKTQKIELDAPKAVDSLSPSTNGIPVFAFYDISAEKENYATDIIKNVPVFDSTVSIQEFNLVWLPASNNQGTSTTENEGNPYTL